MIGTEVSVIEWEVLFTQFIKKININLRLHTWPLTFLSTNKFNRSHFNPVIGQARRSAEAAGDWSSPDHRAHDTERLPNEKVTINLSS